MPETLTSTDWGVIAGIIGALVGVFLGSFFTYKMQARQIAHENSTRFHDLRIEKYAEFTKAANEAVSRFVTDQYDYDLCSTFQTTYNTVRLVASNEVLAEAIKLSNSFGTMLGMVIEKTKIPNSEVVTFNTLLASFITQARHELSTWK